ncbi:hypothetical protein PIB30_041305 [Stylosanthes scabra]|uniref:F-box/LRR-repeat protein 15-like leucin rich repeat domain-containing protein n=1 Tax=Stylosanthes scabra TaxID=79078 RepID=A0ABU6QFG3_9FABA|nr:hypothetical protein [Stylosanthes scabra]
MGDLSTNYETSIMDLPDGCLTIIFHGLDCRTDRESFALTCRKWLYLRDSNLQSLQFSCSSSGPLPLSTNGVVDLNTIHLPRLMRRFQQFESISLSGCRWLNDAGLSVLLGHGSNLLELNLDCCLNVNDYGLSLVSSACPSLTSISLHGCHDITDLGLETLASTCLCMEYVDISQCTQISDNGLRALTWCCRQLKGIKISYCDGITGVGFSGCSNTLARIEADYCNLNLEGIKGIVSSGGIEYLDVSCGGLKYLDAIQMFCSVYNPIQDPLAGIAFCSTIKILNFRLCKTVTDPTVIAIAKGCKLVEEWNLALCHGVSIPGWKAVGFYCNNLKTLHVNGCRRFNFSCLAFFRDGCESLSTVYITNSLKPFEISRFSCKRPDVCLKFA